MYELVAAAEPHAAAFKPNLAFYLAHGPAGLRLLVDLCAMIRVTAPHALLILDIKFGDTDDTNMVYMDFVRFFCNPDAVTVHPYMGYEAMKPFLGNERKGAFILCRTSNKGAGELQDLQVEGHSLFVHVARHVQKIWNMNGNCGLVTGATYPGDIKLVCEIAPELPLLIPGVGKQGGDLENSVRNAGTHAPFVINQSSSFMYASAGEDFAQAGAAVLQKANTDIRAILYPSK